ncbi:hypothetical protein PILCRDRAFT_829978 [Piloderma croceum F 1598]|uniref:Uncharacterized protein n=1 Tax=Piloderma croceum (strain F 1598) TaxID=765440 RepID=A0A0C3EHN4_PILCF|nr:hypothetical protein PILCRDRAFT_829978 [Piloderma croceum F 1598]
MRLYISGTSSPVLHHFCNSPSGDLILTLLHPWHQQTDSILRLIDAFISIIFA